MADRQDSGRSREGAIGRAWRIAAPVLLIVVVAVGGWLVFTGARAVAAAGDLQDAVDAVETSAAAADLDSVRAAATDAVESARRADSALQDPVWAAIAVIPYLGDTAEVARETTAVVAAAASGLEPLVDVADVLAPASLYVNGRFNLERMVEVQQPVSEAAAALAATAEQMATIPTRADGAWVLGPVDRQRQQAADQLAAAADAMATAESAVAVLPDLLGASGPRTWFVGLQSPAEARGTGGFLGTYVLLRADDGRLTLESTGSNSDFDLLPELPDFGEQFRFRYGDEPKLVLNSNLSPHFPYAAEIWRAFAADSLDVEVDVVAAADVLTLGYLVDALEAITLPDGRKLDGRQMVDFALKGIYAQFPDSNERKLFQEAIAEQVFTLLTTTDFPVRPAADAVGQAIRERRLLLWSPLEREEQLLLDLPTSGSVAAHEGPYAFVAINNGTGSKLEAYLEREMTYQAGRCTATDRVDSALTVTLTSVIPDGTELPRYVVGLAEVGPEGPISTIQLQVHLGPEAAVDAVTLDGEPLPTYAFREQGRLAFLVEFDLEPRRPAVLRVSFNEPASEFDVSFPVQPLALPAKSQVREVPCETTETTEAFVVDEVPRPLAQ